MKIIKFLIAILVLLAVTGSLSAREDGLKSPAKQKKKALKKISKAEKKLAKAKVKHGWAEESSAVVQVEAPSVGHPYLNPEAQIKPIEESSAHTNGERVRAEVEHINVKPNKGEMQSCHSGTGKNACKSGNRMVTSSSGRTGPPIKNTVVHINKLPKKAPVHKGKKGGKSLRL